MKLRTISPSKLYHGSVHLYKINCYIRKNKALLNLYLQSSALVDAPVESFTFWYKMRLLQARYLSHTYPVTKEILYIMTLQLLYSYNQEHLSVSRTWDNYLELENKDELIIFAINVEARAPYAFDVNYYSAMRLPLQYFSTSYDTASFYAQKNGTGVVYDYNLEEKIELPDITDKKTCVELGATTFSSTTPYKLKELLEHTKYLNIVSLRKHVLFNFESIMGGKSLKRVFDKFCSRRERITDDTKALEEDWSTYYDTELICPYVLWQLRNYEKPGAFSLYEVNALLMKTMIDEGRWKGYVDDKHQAIVIIRPWEYGKINTMEKGSYIAQCDYY